MKKLYSLFVLLLPAIAFAQSNFKPGYIVSSKGDTVKGTINYRDWGQNPSSIEFKAGQETNSQKLEVRDISAFGIDGFETYKTYTVKVSLDTTDLSRPTQKKADTTNKVATVFLRQLQKGKNIILYGYTDDLKSRFYFTENTNAKPEELVYKKYVNADNIIITKNTFRGQLIVIANNLNMANLEKQIGDLSYNEPELIKITAKINGLSQAQIAATTMGASTPVRFFVGAGVNINSLKYEGQTSLANGNGATAVFPQITFGFENYINPNVGRLILRTELSFAMGTYTITGTGTTSNSITDTVTQTVKQLSFTFTPQVIYNIYNTDGVKVFVGMGISVFASAYPTNTYTDNLGKFGVVKQTNFPEFRGFSGSLPFKAGLTLNKKIELYASYTPPIVSITDNYDLFSANVATFGLGFNYFLGKKAK